MHPLPFEARRNVQAKPVSLGVFGSSRVASVFRRGSLSRASCFTTSNASDIHIPPTSSSPTRLTSSDPSLAFAPVVPLEQSPRHDVLGSLSRTSVRGASVAGAPSAPRVCAVKALALLALSIINGNSGARKGIIRTAKAGRAAQVTIKS